MRNVRIRSHTFELHEKGSEQGASFVLVHGLGVSSRYFGPLADELAKEGRVYVLDLPGFNQTPRSKKTITVSEYASLVAELIDKESIDNPVLIGQSMGCQIVTELVLQRPEITDKIVLIGPTVNPKERNAFMQALRLFQNGLHEPLKVNLLTAHDYIRCGLSWYFKINRQMLADKIEERLPHLQTKTLVIRGQNDVIVSHEWAEKVAKLLPNATRREIPDAGHVAMYKQAELVAKECLDFL